ncbi:MAG: uracil-DNA glycosylase family protein [Methanomassiliicoccales archaeon]
MEFDPDCTRCPLSRDRTNVVPPDGDRRSPVALVGEAPGRMEDLQARPFVGRAGNMLDRMLEEGEVSRESVLITNTVKCRPPDNRVPRAEERRACFPYLEQELEGKSLVVTLGRTASSNILGKGINLSRDANVKVQAKVNHLELVVMPTYHPAACLFNLTAREGLREAIGIIKKEL